MKNNLFVLILICCMWCETTSLTVQLPTYTTHSAANKDVNTQQPKLDKSESHRRMKRWARYGNRVWNDTIKIGYANYANRYIYSRRDQDHILKECTDVSLYIISQEQKITCAHLTRAVFLLLFIPWPNLQHSWSLLAIVAGKPAKHVWVIVW